ncbi:hypothetical protein CYY_005091 [Polysphondylium violaceum]|uniref:Uncharacterized protein n=1 Tax=Polysphondylium violaceum TaxID=133409 RepID=A0A8J4PVF5_9MYCE|nr:hypothetical protein CYY_005091 [Polysphondylium violaceum]
MKQKKIILSANEYKNIIEKFEASNPKTNEALLACLDKYSRNYYFYLIDKFGASAMTYDKVKEYFIVKYQAYINYPPYTNPTIIQNPNIAYPWSS